MILLNPNPLSLELLIIAMLGVVSHFRFKRLLKNLKHEINGVFMTSRIQHYQDLNIVLSMTLFLFSISMVTLTADGLTQTKRLNQSKFYADFLICNGKWPWLMKKTYHWLVWKKSKCIDGSHLGPCHPYLASQERNQAILCSRLIVTPSSPIFFSFKSLQNPFYFY